MKLKKPRFHYVKQIQIPFFQGNICVRLNPGEHQGYLCSYDWELCTLGVPQRDVASFLGDIVHAEEDEDNILDVWQFYIETYRQEFLANSSDPRIIQACEYDSFYKIFKCELMGILLQRICINGILNKKVRYAETPVYLSICLGFLERVWENGKCFEL